MNRRRFWQNGRVNTDAVTLRLADVSDADTIAQMSRDLIESGLGWRYRTDRVRRMASQYKLRVELSGQGGEYRVANRLQLVQGASVVADVPDAGPWLLLDVPAGRYTLVGDFADRQLRRDVTVAGTGTTVHWVLPARTN